MPTPPCPLPAWPAAPLHGRVVLVTGGAQGIGRAIAEAVLGAGGAVVVGDLDVQAGHACLGEWGMPARSAFARLDVARERGVARLVATALKKFGRIDGLVNNAGPPDPHVPPLPALDWAGWNARLASLHGAFLCSKHALPALRQSPGGGAVVNILSTRAYQSEPHSEAYAAAKGGLLAFTHALALSEGPQVRVNAIAPGWIATDAWQAPSRRRRPRLSRRDHAQHPAGRVGLPPDIAHLAVYLLAPALSGFVTGQDFIVDGGMSRRMQYV